MKIAYVTVFCLITIVYIYTFTTRKKADLCLLLFVFNVYENKSPVWSDEANSANYPVSKKQSTGIAVEENSRWSIKHVFESSKIFSYFSVVVVSV